MYDIILGNVFSIGAMLSESFSGTRKTKRGMLLVQCISQIFYIASSLVLKGYSATVQNVVAIVRNLVAAKGKPGKLVQWILIILPVVLGIYFNNRGFIGILPVVANLVYSVSVFAFEDDARKLKYAFIFNCALFCVFNFAILNFVSGVSCIVIITTTTIALVKEHRAAKAEE